MGFPQARNNSGIRRYWPVFGFLMIIALGAIAWFLAPGAQAIARQLIPRFHGTELPKLQMQLVFTGVVFVILGCIAAAIVAVFAPRSKMRVSETDLIKEREAMLKDRLEQKKRQQKINRQMRNQ